MEEDFLADEGAPPNSCKETSSLADQTNKEDLLAGEYVGLSLLVETYPHQQVKQMKKICWLVKMLVLSLSVETHHHQQVKQTKETCWLMKI